MLSIVGETMVEDEDRQRATMFFGATLEGLAKAFAGARAVEREACAKAVEKVLPVRILVGGTSPAECKSYEQPNHVATVCAAAVRARNKWVVPTSRTTEEG